MYLQIDHFTMIWPWFDSKRQRVYLLDTPFWHEFTGETIWRTCRYAILAWNHRETLWRTCRYAILAWNHRRDHMAYVQIRHFAIIRRSNIDRWFLGRMVYLHKNVFSEENNALNTIKITYKGNLSDKLKNLT